MSQPENPQDASESVRKNVTRLLLLTVALVVVIGLRFVWLSPAAGMAFQIHAGYYVVLLALGLWVLLGVKFLKSLEIDFRELIRTEKCAAVLILTGTVILQIYEPHVLRVLYDETSHAAGALVMHYEKKAVMPAISHYVGDVFVIGDFYPSFRQYLFQVVVSLAHDLTGYRLSNVFFVNGLLTFLLLVATYAAAKMLAGRLAGYCSLGLLITLPLLAQNATSGGYDVLNLFLVATLLLIVFQLVNVPASRRKPSLDFAVFTALLLSMSRYESILYLIPLAGIVAWLWIRERAISLTWYSVISPFFLLPNMVSNLIMFSNPRYLHAHLRKAGEEYFGLNYLPKHISEAVFYLFQYDNSATNSLLLSIVGVISILFLLIYVIRYGRTLSTVSVFAIFSVWIVLLYIFVLSQFWSSPTDILASRFILPLYLVFALAGGWLTSQFALLRKSPRFALFPILGWFIIYTAPTVSKSMATYGFVTSRGENWLMQKASQSDRTQTLYVASSNVGLVANKFASAGIDMLNKDSRAFVRALKAGLYKDIIIYQSMEIDPKTGDWIPRSENALNANLVTEFIDSKIITPSYKAQMLRLVGYRRADGELIDRNSNAPELSLKAKFDNLSESEAYRLSLYPH